MIDDLINEVSSPFFNFILRVFKMLLTWGSRLWDAITHEFELFDMRFQFWELLIAVGAIFIIIRALTR